ncbi:unnamed protein product [Phaedon cochleariae]|uniref:Uncharacterized protein n=1 Tax=Phaedon cochleariae TaxID=80249 RepID=A0A9N9X0H7_PHACE|nr:unnamed protein product [Phaedon cochleariae]
MEIDVTPDTISEKNSSNSSHGDDEKDDNPSATIQNVSNTNLSTSNSNKDYQEHERTNTKKQKTIKHALRHQAKRRRKNTTIASNTNSLPRIIVKPLPTQTVEETTLNIVPTPTSRTPTMREVLASIPGFNMKPRKRTTKKLSTAAQLEQTKAGCIDLETPDSILVNTNLRHLLNKATFAALPLLYQNKLVQLLPSVDRNIVASSSDPSSIEINSGFHNEFFARACLEWQDRLAEGEFTPENQQKLKLEADKERNKVDPWKLKHFEPIWGDRSEPTTSTSINVHSTSESSRPPIKTTIKLRPSTTNMTKQSKTTAPPPMKRLRTVGAMTRSCTSMKSELTTLVENKIPIPDLLPIKQLQKEEVPLKSECSVSIVIETPVNDNLVQLQEKCIVNISDTILENNEETIIICSSKRPRSPSIESEQNSPKRKTPSPLSESLLPTSIPMDTSEPEKDVILEELQEVASEAPSDDDKASETMSETAVIEEVNMYDYEKDKILDENSSSLSSIAIHHMEENSSNETIETVDSLQLHVDYKEDTNQTDETSSTTTTTTDVKSEQEDQEEQEETMTSTPDMSDLAPMETDPLQITEHDTENSESNPEEKESYTLAVEEIDEQEMHGILENENAEVNSEIPEQPVELGEESIVEDTFQILPNTLILQEQSIVINKPSCSEECGNDNYIAVTAEKLASVEECDLVLAQLSETNFNVRSIPDEDDRFIDAENYVLESGQISIANADEEEKERDAVDIQATLFGENEQGATEECCWGMVDSSTEKLLQIPSVHALDNTVPTPVEIVGTDKIKEHVQMIPIQEEHVQMIPMQEDHVQVMPMQENHVQVSMQENHIQVVPMQENHIQVIPMQEEHVQVMPIQQEHVQVMPEVMPIQQEHVQVMPMLEEHSQVIPMQEDHAQVMSMQDDHAQVMPMQDDHVHVMPMQDDHVQVMPMQDDHVQVIPMPDDHVQVIPMQEELEVKLERGTFPVVMNDWPYDVNIDSDMVAAALGNTEGHNSTKEMEKANGGFSEFAGSGNQVKLELEVTLTPEILSSDSMITSTVSTSGGGANLMGTLAVSKAPTKTVIPPTTIVCLPSTVTTAAMMNSVVNEVTQCAPLPRPGTVQSSSALPLLSLSTSQPIRAVTSHGKVRPRGAPSAGGGNAGGGGGGGSRGRGGSKPPPGAVNLERSYQICQAVIQNSPNRDQLRGQLKPPPSLLAVAHANNKKNESNSSDSPSDIEEAAQNALLTMIPEKSKERYDIAYRKFENWCEEKKVKHINEKVMLAYFEGHKSLKASTLWSGYSMLRCEIALEKYIDIKKYTNLLAFLKRQSDGYQAKKSNVLSKEHISQFLMKADDKTFLMAKVAMIIGIYGACRKSELTFLRIEDVVDEHSYFLVNIPMTKTKVVREFIITMGDIDGLNLVEILRKYMKLCPQNLKHNRFFVKYNSGKCGVQPVGINTFGNLPKTIARFIGLPNSVLFTGHCFRRSSATLLADSGADLTRIKRHGGWKSSSVAEGYVENSLQNKKKTATDILGQTNNQITTSSTSSTSLTSGINISNCTNCVINANAVQLDNLVARRPPQQRPRQNVRPTPDARGRRRRGLPRGRGRGLPIERQQWLQGGRGGAAEGACGTALPAAAAPTESAGGGAARVHVRAGHTGDDGGVAAGVGFESRYVLLADILLYLDGKSRPVVEEEAVLRANHVILCEAEDFNKRHIFALCLQTSAMKSSPHEMVDGQTPMGVGQYILVQRAGLHDPHHHHATPRSSSAPPAQQQMGGASVGGGAPPQVAQVGGAGRGRPASVEVDHPSLQGQPLGSNDFVVQCPNPGTQAVTRRQRLPSGVVYGDVSLDGPPHSAYTIIGGGAENVAAMHDHPAAAMQSQLAAFQKKAAEQASCACSLKAMVVCKKCGAFCHDDCIGPGKKKAAEQASCACSLKPMVVCKKCDAMTTASDWGRAWVGEVGRALGLHAVGGASEQAMVSSLLDRRDIGMGKDHFHFSMTLNGCRGISMISEKGSCPVDNLNGQGIGPGRSVSSSGRRGIASKGTFLEYSRKTLHEHSDEYPHHSEYSEGGIRSSLASRQHGLLAKLPFYGLPPQLCSLLASFLSNRSLHVVVDGVSSDSLIINAGVPQGSILAPTLFLLHINDLLEATHVQYTSSRMIVPSIPPSLPGLQYQPGKLETNEGEMLTTYKYGLGNNSRMGIQ